MCESKNINMFKKPITAEGGACGRTHGKPIKAGRSLLSSLALHMPRVTQLHGYFVCLSLFHKLEPDEGLI